MDLNETAPKYKFYEFFAGGGMARLGLGDEWECAFANDFSPRKVRSYRENFSGASELREGDVFDLSVEDLPGGASLAWASFPCQDLSLAGNGRGLHGVNSGSFWGFWQLMARLAEREMPVPIIVLENVVGTISVRGGQDFQTLLNTAVDAGYYVGPLVMDAVDFVPQSRPRLFIVAVHRSKGIPQYLMQSVPNTHWHPASLVKAYATMPKLVQDHWVWWDLPFPVEHTTTLDDLVEHDSGDIRWHTTEQTSSLLAMMGPVHRSKLATLKRLGRRSVGTVYRRIRHVDGEKAQRAELRIDGISGCLRTGSGGSSKQFLLIVDGEQVRSRLLTPREAARLMGVPESYKLPENYSEAYHLMGDGLAVPVVDWLARNILTPLAGSPCIPYETTLPTLSLEQQRLLERRNKLGIAVDKNRQ